MEGNNNNNNNGNEDGRWTCEACGCNTNATSDRSCSICGTSSGPSILRRAGYAASAGMFGRGGLPGGVPGGLALSLGGGRRGFMNDDIDELWGRVVDGVSLVSGDDEAMAALAMEVSGQPAANRNRDSARQRLLDAARNLHFSGSDNTNVDTEEVMEAATENARSFQPRWISPTGMGGRVTTGNGIEVGEGERQHVAHLPIGAGEGRSVRTEDPIPRSMSFAALVPSRGHERRSRRSYGFRVAFDKPQLEAGISLGGGYLVGVTTSSFSNFSERNGLQQSPLFWGIEDGGNKFEGSRYGHAAPSDRRRISNYAMEVGPDEAPQNSDSVLFGAREVVTVVIDIESRTLTFWRNDQLLGTLVSNLPRGSDFYPIAVPNHAGATVAITGMDGDPLTLLQTFSAGWKQEQQQRDTERREKLRLLRSVLVKNGNPSPELTAVLKSIFALYATQDTHPGGEDVKLDMVEAGRLWYRCGLKLSCLDDLFLVGKKEHVTFDDFMEVITKIVGEEESQQVPSPRIVIGDKVELAEGYQTKGDALAGPLQPGDRGTVVELQQGPSGEMHSVRVLHGGRRWWYQPQAVLSERSGVVESPSAWFLHRVLRAHGYDHTTLQSFVGKPVTSTSWECGDIVVPKKISPVLEPEASLTSPMDSIVGRIVPNSVRHNNPQSQRTTRGSDSTMVPVEFVNENFIASTGLPIGTEVDDLSDSLETRRVRVNKLVHSTVFDGVSVVKKSKKAKKSSDATETTDNSSSNVDGDLKPFSDEVVDEKLKKDIASIAKLETSSIETIAKECKRRPGSVPLFFSFGLAEAILAALDSALEQTKSSTPSPSLQQAVASLGVLVVRVIEHVFLPNQEPCADEDEHASKEDGPFDNSSGDETMDDAASNASDSRPIEALEERGSNDGAGNGRMSTLQQRRSMLLALMSRARRGNTGSLNELVERENGEVDLSQLVPGLNAIRASSSSRAFLSGLGAEMMQDGGPWEWEDFVESARENRPPREGQGGPGNDLSGRERTTINRGNEAISFLGSVLHGSNTDPSSVPTTGDGSATHLSRIIFNGLLSNSLPWVQAAVDMQNRRRPPRPNQRQTHALHKVTDEDGVPVLLVAVSLGCSVSILNCLIQSGAPVRTEELRKAAYTNQPDALAAMLRHVAFSDGIIDLERCTNEIRDVLEKSQAFQSELKKKMMDSTGDFVSNILKGLVNFGLACRSLRHRSKQWDMCSETISGVLSQISRENLKSNSKSSSGLLNIVPSDVLAEALFCETHQITKLWLLIEDHLYSKDIYDGAVGLSLLCSLLRKFPVLSTSTEIERFGFAELVASHGALASTRLKEASAQQASTPQGQASSRADGSILCPAGHTAKPHITRHASFRCDLCGAGVDRGRPMHGCRDCDWDACEKCTDQCTLHVKNSCLKDLADECHQLLNREVSLSEVYGEMVSEEILQKMSSMDSTSKLHSLSIRLQQEDVMASRELSAMLEEPGRITVHQFSKMILPSLHASLRSNGVRGGAGRQNKRARVGGGSFRHAEVASVTVKHLLGKEQVESASDGNPSNGAETASESPRPAASSATGTPKIVERLHQILSFYESVSSTSTPRPADAVARGALKSLTQPISIELCPSPPESPPNSFRSKVLAEPLVTFEELELQILRTCKFDNAPYTCFCQELATDQAIIVEQSRCGSDRKWRLGRVTSYDGKLGAHTVRYASPWRHGNANNCRLVEIGTSGGGSSLDSVKFEGDEKRLILATREYYVVHRSEDRGGSSSSSLDVEFSDGGETEVLGFGRAGSGGATVGMRVETSASSNERTSHTILAIHQQNEKDLVLVSDSGEVWECSSSQVIFPVSSNSNPPESARGILDRGRQERGSRSFPFLSGSLARRESGRTRSTPDRIGVMKRSWSALSLIESMRPVELSARDESVVSKHTFNGRSGLVLSCDQGALSIDQTLIETPLMLRVEFSAHDTLPTVDFQAKRHLPLIGALTQLIRRSESQGSPPYAPNKAYVLYFSIKASERKREKGNTQATPPIPLQWESLPDGTSSTLGSTQGTSMELQDASMAVDMPQTDGSPRRVQRNRSRKLSLGPFFGEDESRYQGLCEGFGEICQMSMEVLCQLSEFSGNPNDSGDEAKKSQYFENVNLSKKLEKELDDPLSVVGCALPEWCSIGPMFCPRLWSYDSRRLLLERSAFGVSRSLIKQQEAKVNVGRLRQRMAALRSRAVELVGEAFSGGAEDPTSLQLQADELYGMEESLNNRVKAAFKAAQWQEHALEVAKFAVERDCLLSGAENIMEKIALDDNLSSRRLEARFFGESGFDEAAGDQAGVTRGFYADVAEALLSCDNVAGVHCSPMICRNDNRLLKTTLTGDPCKLPLFIPDMDGKSQVIIPTPRSDPRSALGVFPRALCPSHPLHGEVLKRYRLMGRLFSSAMRDGFMFPLPLSSSFLKFVQHCECSNPRSKKVALNVSSKQGSLEDLAISDRTILTTLDLPRPGFLGGEVYAVDLHICRALDGIDASDDPPLNKHDRDLRYQEIAADKNFARIALGSDFDCSFEDYFEDRTFVDPLDPTQGELAVPLCSGGHKKQVTIYNIRDWVALARQFLLHDGILAQAQAFRSGVNDFFCADYLRLFTPEELQRDVCGSGDNVDQWTESDIRKLIKLDGGKGAHEALVAVAAIGGEGGAAMSRRFSTSSPTIAFLVKALLEASPKQRRQFLNFVTSVPIVTPGNIEVVPIVSPSGEFLPMRDPGCLPRANTCARRLYVPKFESFDTFAEVLWAVVREESKFKGFFEWRGS